ncbi:hypothetical protein ACHQM5_031084 [Ranunculus cassubicifolius]
MQPQSGGKFRPRLNTGERPLANKYREGKMKRTLKKRVKECLKLSGGSGWGPAMRVGRMRNGESWSATRLGARTDADCGGDPSLGCCYAYGDVVSRDRGGQHAPYGVPRQLRAPGVGQWAPPFGPS